jgi:hypothetical protein
MIAKARNYILRCAVWLMVALLVLAFCPGPVDGNWILLPDSARNHCGCDSHDFERRVGGSWFSVNSNHKPPYYNGSYQKMGGGEYRGICPTSYKSVSFDGFTTLLFAFEFSDWGSKVEFNYYIRDFHPLASRSVTEQAGMTARRLGAKFSVVREDGESVKIMSSEDQGISLDDVDSLVDKSFTNRTRLVLVQSDLSEFDVAPLVSRLNAHGLKVRVEPHVKFK